jgi:hypothetical protein
MDICMRSGCENLPRGAGELSPGFQPIGAKIILRRFDGRMAFVPEGQHESSQARSAFQEAAAHEVRRSHSHSGNSEFCVIPHRRSHSIHFMLLKLAHDFGWINVRSNQRAKLMKDAVQSEVGSIDVNKMFAAARFLEFRHPRHPVAIRVNLLEIFRVRKIEYRL